MRRCAIRDTGVGILVSRTFQRGGSRVDDEHRRLSSLPSQTTRVHCFGTPKRRTKSEARRSAAQEHVDNSGDANALAHAPYDGPRGCVCATLASSAQCRGAHPVPARAERFVSAGSSRFLSGLAISLIQLLAASAGKVPGGDVQRICGFPSHSSAARDAVLSGSVDGPSGVLLCCSRFGLDLVGACPGRRRPTRNGATCVRVQFATIATT